MSSPTLSVAVQDLVERDSNGDMPNLSFYRNEMRFLPNGVCPLAAGISVLLSPSTGPWRSGSLTACPGGCWGDTRAPTGGLDAAGKVAVTVTRPDSKCWWHCRPHGLCHTCLAPLP